MPNVVRYLKMKTKIKLSIAIATYNEETNIAACLNSVKDIADEIVIVDGSSTDNTVKIAKTFGAKVIITENHPIFHLNKQKAFDNTTGEWILYLDADERVSKKLADEIKKIINMTDQQICDYEQNILKNTLFNRHLKLLEKRDGKIGIETADYVAFFVPRLNYFLGKYLKFGGVYPDGVIRLFKKDQAYLPCKSVHEQMVVKGRVGWLQNDLLHIDSPTFNRYLERNSRYIDLLTTEMKKEHLQKNLSQAINYFLIKPIWWFLITQLRYKGILDGIPGILFSFFSALRFPRAYFRYLMLSK